MDEKDEKPEEKKEVQEKDLPFEIIKASEYHKPPAEEDEPPPPTPNPNQEPDKD